MERLTKRFEGWVMRKGCHGPCRTCHRAECADIYPMIDRLAAYEDTGLEPKDISAIQRREQGLSELLANISWGVMDLAGHVTGQIKEGAKIYRVRFNFDGNCYEIIEKDFDLGLFRPEDFGRIIFRTREEAEAALKKREEEDNEAD